MGLPHVVVDGSNIATEGHSLPSLAQLDEAVGAFIDQYHPEKVTVVVDATFGHRIAESERATYEEAVLAGEMVSPPAGAIGRGDAFVLQIADVANAVVFSNDSFQEFHGTYTWLFDEGRLIGGKPVPAVGWVFVNRAPVRGPTSRKATKDARKGRARKDTSAKGEIKKLPKPTIDIGDSPPPKVGDKLVPRGAQTTKPRAKAASKAPAKPTQKRSSSKRREPMNTMMPFLDFVGNHPEGSRVQATVDRFSSHGAYVTVGDVEAYVPLKLMGDPPPRRARDVLTVGERRVFEVHHFDPPNRGIDLVPVDEAVPTQPALAADEVPDQLVPSEEKNPMASPAKKKAPAKKAPAKKAPAKKAPAKKAPAKKAPAKKAPAKKAPAKKAPAKKAPAKKAPAKKR